MRFYCHFLYSSDADCNTGRYSPQRKCPYVARLAWFNSAKPVVLLRFPFIVSPVIISRSLCRGTLVKNLLKAWSKKNLLIFSVAAIMSAIGHPSRFCGFVATRHPVSYLNWRGLPFFLVIFRICSFRVCYKSIPCRHKPIRRRRAYCN